MTTDQTRAAFEAWFTGSRRSRGADKRPTFERREDGTYDDDHTQRHWWTWQTAQQAIPAGWQPIETAPKDGSKIMLSDSVWVGIGWYAEYTHPFSGIECAEWATNFNAEFGVPDKTVSATHWMPLPAAPKP